MTETDTQRGTGRTTRMMELATAMAEREEVKIFAIFANPHSAAWAGHRWPKVTCLSVNSAQVESGRLPGEPRFHIRGVPQERVFVDHYAAELFGYIPVKLL